MAGVLLAPGPLSHSTASHATTFAWHGLLLQHARANTPSTLPAPRGKRHSRAFESLPHVESDLLALACCAALPKFHATIFNDEFEHDVETGEPRLSKQALFARQPALQQYIWYITLVMHLNFLRCSTVGEHVSLPLHLPVRARALTFPAAISARRPTVSERRPTTRTSRGVVRSVPPTSCTSGSARR